jgi:uncharacterized glyoxalase superfamily protein PhnB
MKVLDTYPLVTVTQLKASRDFFVAHLGMTVLFEASWVVILSSKPDGPIALGLMSADHPSRPPGSETFDGQGMIITVQVEDAPAACAHLKAGGAPIDYELHDEPWGQKRFMTRDPSGIRIDVVEQIEPAPGFWDRYCDP